MIETVSLAPTETAAMRLNGLDGFRSSRLPEGAAFSGPRPESMTPAERERWRALIKRRCGLHFSPSRQTYLERRLRERMRVTGAANFDSYFRQLVSGHEVDSEWTELVELLVTGESQFFRHRPSFDALRESVLPDLLARRDDETDLHLWSVGCARGEEPYSLAMLLAGMALPASLRVHVMGSDISAKALADAKRAVYPTSAMADIPSEYERFFCDVATSSGRSYLVADGVRSKVRFLELNLRRLEACSITDQDIIFCQNVLIYFAAEERRKIVSELVKRLKRGGFLFLAPAELLDLTFSEARFLPLKETLILQRPCFV